MATRLSRFNIFTRNVIRVGSYRSKREIVDRFCVTSGSIMKDGFSPLNGPILENLWLFNRLWANLVPTLKGENENRHPLGGEE